MSDPTEEEIEEGIDPEDWEWDEFDPDILEDDSE